MPWQRNILNNSDNKIGFCTVGFCVHFWNLTVVAYLKCCSGTPMTIQICIGLVVVKYLVIGQAFKWRFPICHRHTFNSKNNKSIGQGHFLIHLVTGSTCSEFIFHSNLCIPQKSVCITVDNFATFVNFSTSLESSVPRI